MDFDRGLYRKQKLALYCESIQMSSMPSTLKAGTRGSPLALWQADKAIAAVQAVAPKQKCSVVKITTSGDRNQQGSLADIGGKGLFSKEIDRALLAREIDYAVHSLKDLETDLPAGIILAAVLPRDDPRDAFIGQSLASLPSDARVGTCSVRRAAQITRLRPDLSIVPMRGNVQTRLHKLHSGTAEATLLSYAGLQRLGLEREAAEIFDTDVMIPAVGQGVIALCIREEDTPLRTLLAKVNHAPTLLAITAERALLAELDGSCHTPIGGYATYQQGRLQLSAILLSPDGHRHYQHQDSATIKETDLEAAQALGGQVADMIKTHASTILAETQ